MTEQRELRAADSDRRAAAERLRAFHDEGRLDFAEYDNRLAQAYSSVTYADLDRLVADLPVRPNVSVATSPALVVPTSTAQIDTEQPCAPRLPLVLRILWINYAFVVAVNLTVWFLVGSGDTYFWPMWLAIPGVVLIGASAVTGAVRAHRRAALEG